MPGNDPKNTLELITSHRVSHLYGLPVMFNALIETATTTACDALMAGYWHDPEATAAAMDDGWFRTGDLGCCDESGYYHFVGRSKEIIISGGSNISPLEVEEVFVRHPAVQEVAVVGKPDPVLAETVAAFVVLKPGQTLSAEDLLKFAESQLALFKLPKTIVFLDALPRSTTGKVHRKTLKDSFARTG